MCAVVGVVAQTRQAPGAVPSVTPAPTPGSLLLFILVVVLLLRLLLGFKTGEEVGSPTGWDAARIRIMSITAAYQRWRPRHNPRCDMGYLSSSRQIGRTSGWRLVLSQSSSGTEQSA